MIIIGTIIPLHAFVKAKRLIIYFRKNIKKPRQEKEGRNLPGKRKKCYNKMPTQLSRLYSLAIRFRLSFAFPVANIMPHCTKKIISLKKRYFRKKYFPVITLRALQP